MTALAEDMAVGTRITVHKLVMVKISTQAWTAHATRRDGSLRMLVDPAHGKVRPHWVPQWWLTNRAERCVVEEPS